MAESMSNTGTWWFEGRSALLVEDNELAHDLVRVIMRKVGMDIDICVNGAEAVQAVQDKSYDLVLMDIQMPVMNGLDATREIRKLDGKVSSLPIIAMSANTQSEDIELGREAGMDAHIGKPIDKQLLYRTISRYIGDGSATKAPDAGVTENESDELPKLAGIDTDDGLQRIAGNLEAYQRMLLNFREKYIYSGTEIENLIKRGDFEKAAMLTHSIKGNSGNIGAKGVHRHVSRLEQACKNASQEEAMSILPDYKLAISEVIDSIQTIPDNASVTRTDTAFEPLEWNKKLAEYIELIEKDFGAAMDGFSSLKILAADRYSDELIELDKYLNDFNVDAALRILNSIRHNQ